MNTTTAPMLCSIASGTIAGSGSWWRQDHQEDRGVRRNDSRTARRLRTNARRAMRRSENAEWQAELGLVDGAGSEYVDGFILTTGDWYRRGENGIAA